MKKNSILRLGLLMAALICGMTANAQNDNTNDSNNSNGEGSKPEEKHAKIYDVVEEPPQFPGGYRSLSYFLAKTIEYPEESKKNGIKGRVVLSFVIEDDGSISNVQVVRSVNPELDKEAVRVAKCMPKWIPGKQNGKAVRVKYNIPVSFSCD